MYGRIDPLSIGKVEVAFFERSFLVQVCLGAYDLSLNFDHPNIGIVTQGPFRSLIGGELQQHSLEGGYLLRPFLNKDVATAKWADAGTLVIAFENGDEIHFLDNSDQFESFVISHEGTTILV